VSPVVPAGTPCALATIGRVGLDVFQVSEGKSPLGF
jgi:hypothetical protein